MITFLSSDAASYISGQNFTVDGCLELAGSLWKSPIILLKNPFKVTPGQSVCMERARFQLWHKRLIATIERRK